MKETYRDWLTERGCSHAHCPHDCEHPQPFVYPATGQLICGACWFEADTVSEVVPCVPGVCK